MSILRQIHHWDPRGLSEILRWSFCWGCYPQPHMQGQCHLEKVTFHRHIYWDHRLTSMRPVGSQSNLNWPCLHRPSRYPYLGNHWIFLVFAKALKGLENPSCSASLHYLGKAARLRTPQGKGLGLCHTRDGEPSDLFLCDLSAALSMLSKGK